MLPSCPIHTTLPSQLSTLALFRAIGANSPFLGHVFKYLESFLVQANSPFLPVLSQWDVSWSPLTPLATVHGPTSCSLGLVLHHCSWGDSPRRGNQTASLAAIPQGQDHCPLLPARHGSAFLSCSSPPSCPLSLQPSPPSSAAWMHVRGERPSEGTLARFLRFQLFLGHHHNFCPMSTLLVLLTYFILFCQLVFFTLGKSYMLYKYNTPLS